MSGRRKGKKKETKEDKSIKNIDQQLEEIEMQIEARIKAKEREHAGALKLRQQKQLADAKEPKEKKLSGSDKSEGSKTRKGQKSTSEESIEMGKGRSDSALSMSEGVETRGHKRKYRDKEDEERKRRKSPSATIDMPGTIGRSGRIKTRGQTIHSNSQCAKLLSEIMKSEDAIYFLTPVDPIALGVPEYYQVIRQPMDFGTIQEKLKNGGYLNAFEFAEDVHLVWRNAIRFNNEKSEVRAMATRMQKHWTPQIQRLLHTESLALPSAPTVRQQAQTQPAIAQPLTLQPFFKSQEAITNMEEQLQELREAGLAWTLAPQYMAYHLPAPDGCKPRTKVKIREYTPVEKQIIRRSIETLPAKNIERLAQIIEEEMPFFLPDKVSSITLDVDALDALTLSRIYSYTKRFSKVTIPKHAETEEIESDQSRGDSEYLEEEERFPLQFTKTEDKTTTTTTTARNNTDTETPTDLTEILSSLPKTENTNQEERVEGF